MSTLNGKSYLLISLLIAMALAAVACGGDDEVAAPTTAPAATARPTSAPPLWHPLRGLRDRW